MITTFDFVALHKTPRFSIPSHCQNHMGIWWLCSLLWPLSKQRLPRCRNQKNNPIFCILIDQLCLEITYYFFYCNIILYLNARQDNSYCRKYAIDGIGFARQTAQKGIMTSVAYLLNTIPWSLPYCAHVFNNLFRPFLDGLISAISSAYIRWFTISFPIQHPTNIEFISSDK